MSTLSNRISRLITAQRQGRAERSIPNLPHPKANRNVREVLRLLCRNGYVESIHDTSTALTVRLKYGPRGEPAIRRRYVVSSSRRRVYLSSRALWQPQTTSGISVISTIVGLRTDLEARQENLGGEVLRALN